MKKFAAAAALALFAAMPAFATTTLDFDAVTGFASIGEFYNGGVDSAGAVGPAFGLSFGGDALAIANDVLGPYFSNAPTPLAVMAVAGPDATMNAVEGLAESVAFSYSASRTVVGGVQVWSGLNGAGTLLASFDLTANAQTGCTDTAFCHFDQVSASFGGVAHSVTFGNAASVADFDNLSVALVPEPSSIAMMALGLAGLAVVARRRQG